jgi:hypothetical protein
MLAEMSSHAESFQDYLLRRRPELLAPAGDRLCVTAAVKNGADAVYFGLECGFNARARAANLHLDTLPEVMSNYCIDVSPGNWWKGRHQDCDEGYAVVDLDDDGSFEHEYVNYASKAAVSRPTAEQ